MSQQIPVVSVDDNPSMAEVVTMLTNLSSEFTHIRHFLSHQDVIPTIQQQNVKVIVLDYEIPGTDTLALLRQIVAQCPDCKVLMLSAHARHDIVQACRRAGAAGYITKDQDPIAILTAMRSIHQGQTPFFIKTTDQASRAALFMHLAAVARRASALVLRAAPEQNAIGECVAA